MSPAVAPFLQSMRDAAAQARLAGSGLHWLDAARDEAMRAFVERGLPDQRNELWKYTSLRALAQRGFAFGDPEALTRAIDERSLALPGVAGPRLVFVNGVFRADLSRLDDLPSGLSLLPLSRALVEDPGPLRFVLTRSRHEGDALDDLNLALASDGVALRVDDGVRVRESVHVVHVGVPAEKDLAWHSRNIVLLGRESWLDLIEHHVGVAEHAHFSTISSEYVLDEHARLGILGIQNADRGASLLRRSSLRAKQAARVQMQALELGAKLARHEVRVELNGNLSRFHGRGAFVLQGRQHNDAEWLITHQGRDSVSDAVWRGVAGGRARGVVHGRILVKPGADGADGSFYNNNLLLSPDAEIDTRPALEIYADEVQANHGATVGQLDEAMLFYLRSRGLPAELARHMLVRAFCAAVLDGIVPDSLRGHCEALLDEQLPELAA